MPLLCLHLKSCLCPIILIYNAYFQVVLETIYIIIRTFIFVVLVVQYPNNAIDAFSIAQVVSAIVLCLSYYGYFYWYIRRLNETRRVCKNSVDIQQVNNMRKNSRSLFYDMQDFPFKSILDFFPGYMENKVCY